VAICREYSGCARRVAFSPREDESTVDVRLRRAESARSYCIVAALNHGEGDNQKFQISMNGRPLDCDLCEDNNEVGQRNWN